MAVALAEDKDFDDGEVGHVVVLVAALEGRPSEKVQGEIRVVLGPQGVVDVGLGEAGFELVDPCLELVFEWGFGFGMIRGWDWG